MGKPEKVRRGQIAPERVDADGKDPKHAARGSVVGKLSPDIISTYFAPELQLKAKESLERYSEEMMHYDDALKAYEAAIQNQTEVEIDASGEQHQDLPPKPVLPKTPLYKSEYWLNEFDEMLKESSDYFHTKNGGWKAHARAARFERIMDERYGRLRPLLKRYPELETMVKTLQRRYAMGYFSPFRQGKPPIPKSTAVIILFMMQRGNLRWEVTVLSVLFFLIGLQPWALVVLVAGGQALMDNRKRRPLKPMKSYMPSTSPYYAVEYGEDEKDLTEEEEAERERQHKIDVLKEPVGTKLGNQDIFGATSHEYDTIILGSGPSTLYTGALLSRAGRKVLVLSPKDDASGCYTMTGSDIPFDVESSDVSRCSQTQNLLAPAIASCNDYQGGVRFAQIGSAADGHAFQILSVPGMGSESTQEEGVPFILRADGARSLVEDAAMSLGDGWPGLTLEDAGNSATAAYIQACNSINATASQYYSSKMLPENAKSFQNSGLYQEATIRYASSFLDSGFPLNAHARSLMAAIGMKGENLKPSQASMGPHVTNVCAAMSGEGMHYPLGGPRAICCAMQKVIEENGGNVLTGVPFGRLVFENESESASDKSSTPPRCIGIQLLDKREIKFDLKKFENAGYKPAVISMLGMISTFIRLLPNEVRDKHNIPIGLPALGERRPVMKILFALKGSAKDLNVTGADFYRLPNCALAQDEMDHATGQVKLGMIGGNDNSEQVEEAAIEKAGATESADDDAEKPKKSSKNKYDCGNSWMQISFPSAKDPSFESRHGKVTTCVVTIEADDDFVTPFETKPKLFAVQRGKGVTHGDYKWLMERVQKDLLTTYPQLEGKIAGADMVGPLYRGLSHTPLRYAAKGVRPQSNYPGLFCGGSDLTVGDSFSASLVGGWLAANAVAGYQPLDILYLDKNISSDIAAYLERPDIPKEGEEDLAVDFVAEEEITEAKGQSSDPPELETEK